MKKRWRLQFLVLAVATTISFGAALPAAAATTQQEPTPIVRQYDPQERGAGSGDKTTTIIWALVGIAAAGAVGGVLYLLKREVGGFPADPDWVAPITILRAGDAAVKPEDFASPDEDQH